MMTESRLSNIKGSLFSIKDINSDIRFFFWGGGGGINLFDFFQGQRKSSQLGLIKNKRMSVSKST